MFSYYATCQVTLTWQIRAVPIEFVRTYGPRLWRYIVARVYDINLCTEYTVYYSQKLRFDGMNGVQIWLEKTVFLQLPWPFFDELLVAYDTFWNIES